MDLWNSESYVTEKWLEWNKDVSWLCHWNLSGGRKKTLCVKW
jgi:hypothetical protein